MISKSFTVSLCIVASLFFLSISLPHTSSFPVPHSRLFSISPLNSFHHNMIDPFDSIDEEFFTVPSVHSAFAPLEHMFGAVEDETPDLFDGLFMISPARMLHEKLRQQMASAQQHKQKSQQIEQSTAKEETKQIEQPQQPQQTKAVEPEPAVISSSDDEEIVDLDKTEQQPSTTQQSKPTETKPTTQSTSVPVSTPTKAPVQQSAQPQQHQQQQVATQSTSNVAQPIRRVNNIMDLLNHVSQLAQVKNNNNKFPTASIKVDLVDNSDRYEVHAEIAGFNKEDIKLSMEEGNVLTIVAEHSEEKHDEDKSRNYLHRERSLTSVRRSVKLPKDINTTQITASFENGILNIAVPKEQLRNNKFIPIN